MLYRWKTVCYIGAGYLNENKVNENYERAVEEGEKVINWLATRRGYNIEFLTFRLAIERTGVTGHYIVNIEVRNDWGFRYSKLKPEKIREEINKHREEILGL